MSAEGPPAGYVRVHAARWRCEVTTLADFRDDAHALLTAGTLHEAASHLPDTRPLQGRAIAYAITLPVSGERVVTRHNQHGGALARLTGDLFVPPTRAPYELTTSLALRERGIRTPEIVMYGVQRAFALWQRADVMTREITDSADLSSYMHSDTSDADRAAAWIAARSLLLALADAGARHHDLNVKNILLARTPGGFEPWVLDVDRVELGAPGNPVFANANCARLLRSARKWRDERGATFDESELAA